jgi:hypothetical protein
MKLLLKRTEDLTSHRDKFEESGGLFDQLARIPQEGTDVTAALHTQKQAKEVAGQIQAAWEELFN